jgi:hypothetical protein
VLNTSGVSVSSTVLLEPGPLIITFHRGIWCPYCRSDLMALMNATFEVQSRGGSLAAMPQWIWPSCWPGSSRRRTTSQSFSTIIAGRETDGIGNRGGHRYGSELAEAFCAASGLASSSKSPK